YSLGHLVARSVLSTRRPCGMPHDTIRLDPTVGNSGRCSRLHVRRGGENRRRGANGVGGCQTAASARFRFPPPDSGVVPFSEVRASPIKSDSYTSGRVGTPFGSIVTLPSSPVLKLGITPDAAPQPGGETGSSATVPTGLADSHEPT